MSYAPHPHVLTDLQSKVFEMLEDGVNHRHLVQALIYQAFDLMLAEEDDERAQAIMLQAIVEWTIKDRFEQMGLPPEKSE